MADAVQAVLDELTGDRVPGLSAVVVRGNEVLWAGAAGYADLERREPARPDTVYLWFSMTKIATATAVVQLAERGRLGLDEPVTAYLPELTSEPPITIRNLLEHGSGLPNPIPVRSVHPASEPGPPSHASSRSGSSSAAAGRERASLRATRTPATSRSERSWPPPPARATRTTCAATCSSRSGWRTPTSPTSDALAPHAATGYQLRRSALTPLFRLMLPRGIVGPTSGRFLSFNRFCVDGPAYGGLIGSAEDTARFLALHTGGGGEVLSPEGVRSMQQLAMHGRKLDVGLGWFRRHGDRDLGAPYVEHLGGGGGFFNMMRLFTESGLGVIVMGNATSYDHQRVAQAALEAFG